MSIFIFIAILIVLILVHEFGHFIAAKKFGIRVDEFGVGYPPKIFGKKFGGTLYSVNMLPFGGFVRIFGETPNDESIKGKDSKRSFVNKPKLIQVLVLAAGVFFNMLFAWLLFSVVFMIGMPASVSIEDIDNPNVEEVGLMVTTVLLDSPAYNAGLKSGDRITSLTSLVTVVGDGVTDILSPRDELLTPESVLLFIEEHGNESIEFEYLRGTEELSSIISPVSGVITEEPERKAIGISMDLVGLLTYNPIRALYEGAIFTMNSIVLVAVGIVGFFASIFALSADLESVAGPVGIVGLVGDASKLGLVFLLNFTAIISINLAIINLLPFPALDGGRILFVIIEKIKGSPMKPVVANTVNALGFAFLIILMLVITYNDIIRLLG